MSSDLRTQLRSTLGGGGMSRVFLARDRALRREVVVKVLSPELAAGTMADGLPWFTMPYVAGESLRARLLRGALSVADALGIRPNVAQALAYAHARGIVYRDIKPENVLLACSTAVIADFGIAKALSPSRTGVCTSRIRRSLSGCRIARGDERVASECATELSDTFPS